MLAVRVIALALVAVAAVAAGGRTAAAADDPSGSLFPLPAPAPVPPADAPAASCRVSDALSTTFQALGASSGVPDGAGGAWYAARPVRGQAATLGTGLEQLGLTVPVTDGPADGLFATGSVRSVQFRTSALLPDSRVPLPNQFWDVQAGGVYVHKRDGGDLWGVSLTGGSASDRPFQSVREATDTAVAFYRAAAGEGTGWLFYLVSSRTGQVGHNIPVPGLAYEFTRDRLRGVVGFPFVSLTERFTDRLEGTFYYAALTDVQAKLTYAVTARGKLYAGFTWANMAWLRADRPRPWEQLFLYEKRLESGLTWKLGSMVSAQAGAGYAFDRYLIENGGFSLTTGRNRVDVAPGPYGTAQLLIVY